MPDTTLKSFNTLNDHPAREIRNALSEGFAKAIQTGDLTQVEAEVATLLGNNQPDIYRQYIMDRLNRYRSALMRITQQKISAPFYQALILWDLELFFEVHEILEAAWLKESGPQKEILQAMIRAAGVWIHLANGNINGARKMAERARATLTELRAEVPKFPGLNLLLKKLAALDPAPPKIGE